MLGRDLKRLVNPFVDIGARTMSRLAISRSFYAVPCEHSGADRCSHCSAAISAWEKYVDETRYIWELPRAINTATIGERAKWYYANTRRSAVYSWVTNYNIDQQLQEQRRVILKKAQTAAFVAAKNDFEARSPTASSGRKVGRPSPVRRGRKSKRRDSRCKLWLLMIPDHASPLIDYKRLGRLLRAIATKLILQKEEWNLRGAIPVIWRARVLLKKQATLNELRTLLQKPENFDGLKERGAFMVDLAGISPVNPANCPDCRFQRRLRREMPAECLNGPWCEDDPVFGEQEWSPQQIAQTAWLLAPGLGLQDWKRKPFS